MFTHDLARACTEHVSVSAVAPVSMFASVGPRVACHSSTQRGQHLPKQISLSTTGSGMSMSNIALQRGI